MFYLIWNVQVETKSVLADFPSLHHLFFVICKLLKDVVVQQPSVALQAKPFEGGFLRQSFSNVSVNLPQHSVDIISWEKFSTLLSGALWPFIFTCLRKGDDLINTKQCQVHLYCFDLLYYCCAHLHFFVSSWSQFYFRYHVFDCLSWFPLCMKGFLHILLPSHVACQQWFWTLLILRGFFTWLIGANHHSL